MAVCLDAFVQTRLVRQPKVVETLQSCVETSQSTVDILSDGRSKIVKFFTLFLGWAIICKMAGRIVILSLSF